MVITVAAAYFVASQSRAKRSVGFWFFLTGNGLWIAWGWYAGAIALIALQIALAVLNVRGAFKNDGKDSTMIHETPN
jgi:hypothetical protein